MKWNFSTYFYIFINIISAIIGFLIFEYEFAKLHNTYAPWAPTPQILFFIFSGILIISSIINLSVILLSIFKKLDKPIMRIGKKEVGLNKIIISSISIQLIIIGIIFAILNEKTFFVLFPWINL